MVISENMCKKCKSLLLKVEIDVDCLISSVNEIKIIEPFTVNNLTPSVFYLATCGDIKFVLLEFKDVDRTYF